MGGEEKGTLTFSPFNGVSKAEVPKLFCKTPQFSPQIAAARAALPPLARPSQEKGCVPFIISPRRPPPSRANRPGAVCAWSRYKPRRRRNRSPSAESNGDDVFQMVFHSRRSFVARRRYHPICPEFRISRQSNPTLVNGYAHPSRASRERPMIQSLSLSDRKLSSSVKWVMRWR